jgi:hypothetical protein
MLAAGPVRPALRRCLPRRCEDPFAPSCGYSRRFHLHDRGRQVVRLLQRRGGVRQWRSGRLFRVEPATRTERQYLYLLLLKSPGKTSGTGASGRAGSSGDNTDESFKLKLGKKVIHVAYKYTTDDKTRALTSETIKVGTTDIKKDGPRVFLVDLTGEKVTYKPVKVALPDVVPDLTDKDSWAKTIIQAVEQLRKKSPEVKKFLAKDRKGD